MTTPPEQLLDRLADEIAAALGAELLGLYVHGSYTAGDFEPSRSDLDLLAVLREEPTATTLELVRPLHARTAVDHPAWADRIEVDYLAATTLATLAERPGPMIRISPGEPLHLFEATRHYLFNVASARAGLALRGPCPTAVVPPVSAASLHAVVREHAASWPEWVAESRGRVGAQAYAVLTLYRLLHHVEMGTQLSKRQAGAWGSVRLPAAAELIGWASRWWYEGGADTELGRFEEVEAFVRAVSAEIGAQG
ncbi:aminoglycoside adenylyltransferase domain-containing protein [Pseudactinotalea sp.]|uniref:aminoglycoside adenylyltransferase domain-containing protein n=1 Tax=Pseudactinotalea sp. TaxID=1926260 RepID=UPI003B3B2B68